VEAIWSETVGKFAADAMLYARERWQPTAPAVEIDARAMSDGTLRFVAILTALLTRPPGSLLVIEEIDNGFHPSRARLLLETLISVGAERRVDIVVTTHNQALLDAVGPDLVPFVFVAHRQSSSGASALSLLEAFEDLPRLLAGSPLGRAAATGALEQMLQSSDRKS
jgi:predicted ATPase